MSWEAIIKKSEVFLSKAFKEDNAFLLFHDDADGCCAAAILLNLACTKTSRGFVDFGSPEEHSVELTSNLVEWLLEIKPKHIVSLDLALTKSTGEIKRLLTFLDAAMLIYDHHVQSKPLRLPKQCVYLNPLNFNLENIPPSYYSHVLHKRFTKRHDACWVAAVGVVGDYRTEECSDLLIEVKRHYPFLYPFESVNQHSALRSPLMTCAHLVNAGYQHSNQHGAKMAVEALREALRRNDPKSFLEGNTEKSEILHKFRREVDEELTENLERFDSEAEFHLNSQLAFYSIKPNFNISSQMATQLQHAKPNMIVAVISPETRKTLKISLRKGVGAKVCKTDLAKLAESTVVGLSYASGGGHRDASGCVLQNEDFEVWKKNMLRILRKALR